MLNDIHSNSVKNTTHESDSDNGAEPKPVRAFSARGGNLIRNHVTIGPMTMPLNSSTNRKETSLFRLKSAKYRISMMLFTKVNSCTSCALFII